MIGAFWKANAGRRVLFLRVVTRAATRPNFRVMNGEDEISGTPTAAPAPHSEAPAAPAPAAPSESAGAGEPSATSETTDATPGGDASHTLHLAGDPQRRRRRRRRRRHGPKPEGAAPDAGTTSETPSEAAPAAAEGDKPAVQQPPRRVRVEAIAAGGEFSLAALPAGDRPRRRRRRRRGARPEGAAPGGEAVAAASGGDAQQQQQQRRERGPRRRGQRDGDRQRGEGGRDQRREGQGGEGRRDGQGREGQARDGQARGERREGQPREGQSRDGERRDRDRGPRRRKGGKPFGKGGDRDRGGRGDRRDKPAPKLYSFESIVDRGFEDVAAPPPAEGEAPAEGGTRRVDWTIVKRTLADQRAAKTVSAQYILKRDGAETEFPNLGAARAAVNKTIVHPEKLTRAKADYPSTKK